MPKAIIIAGTSSGCGKTSVTLGLMQALTRKGLVVQGFKSGPDFIDPGLHHSATGLFSHNLDGWMLSEEEVCNVFRRNHQGCDVSIIEGAMGLFDGLGPHGEEGSTAQLAKILDVPVLLVAGARGMGRSAAALVKGYAEFDPALTLYAVLFNMTGSPTHGRLLAQAMEVLPQIRVLGSLPRVDGLQLPSHHLGLVTAEDLDHREERLSALADWVEQSLDLDALLDALPDVSTPSISDGGKIPEVRIGYAKDRAFCFYYEENLCRLRQAGAELIPFSPLEDVNLPPALHGLYLGGGYPEAYAAKLADNTAMREKILDFCRSGRPVYAECGGFMYLMRSITDQAGREFPMAGVFDFACAAQDRHQALGYREVEFTTPTFLEAAGGKARGHEFHYSRLHGADSAAIEVYRALDRAGQTRDSGYLKHNCLASYTYLHFGSNPDLAPRFVEACRT